MQAIPSETGNQELLRRGKAPSVQDYRQRTSQQVEHSDEDLRGRCVVGWEEEKRKSEEREPAGEREKEKFQSGRSGWKEGSPECTTLQASSPTLRPGKNSPHHAALFALFCRPAAQGWASCSSSRQFLEATTTQVGRWTDMVPSSE